MDLDRIYENYLTRISEAATQNEKYRLVIKLAKFGQKHKYGKAFDFCGDCHSTGTILPKSSTGAYGCYQEAGKLGFIPSFIKCGMYWEEICYRDPSAGGSCFNDKDYRQYALSDYFQAARRNNAQAQYRLANLYISFPFYNLEKAEKWYIRAIKNGFSQAKESLDWCKKNSGLFDKTKNGKKAVLEIKECDEIGKIVKNSNGEKAVILDGCSCWPEVKCYLGDKGDNGIFYTDHFNIKKCSTKKNCFKYLNECMDHDIRDIKTKAEAFPSSSSWEFVNND